MHLSPLLPLHLPLVQALAYKIWPPTYGEILSPAQLQYMLERFYSIASLTEQVAGGQQFLGLWEKEEALIGFAGYGPLSEMGGWKLHKLYVLPCRQGTGAGKKLLQAVEQEARSAGATRLLLNVNRYNKALYFYKAQGYKIVLEEDLEIGNGYFMNDYQMAKEF